MGDSHAKGACAAGIHRIGGIHSLKDKSDHVHNTCLSINMFQLYEKWGNLNVGKMLKKTGLLRAK
jgi:hypothetical protein